MKTDVEIQELADKKFQSNDATTFASTFAIKEIWKDGFKEAQNLLFDEVYSKQDMENLLLICMKASVVGTSDWIKEKGSEFINDINKTNIIDTDDVKHLDWIYNRMLSVYNENPNYDYLRKLKQIINKLNKNQ